MQDVSSIEMYRPVARDISKIYIGIDPSQEIRSVTLLAHAAQLWVEVDSKLTELALSEPSPRFL